MIIDLFIPCTIDLFRPQIGLATLKLLENVGCSVNYPLEQTCCGRPAYQEGYWDEAKSLGDKFIREFHGDRMVVCPSSACTGMVCQHYLDLFNNSALHNEYKTLKSHVIELSEFLTSYLKITQLGASLPGKAVFVDSCNGLRECGIKDEPRTLLKMVKGLNLVELKSATTCCGYGGNMSAKFEPLAQVIAMEKIDEIKFLNVDYVISNELNCLMHLENCWPANEKKPQFMHLAEVLVHGLNN